MPLSEKLTLGSLWRGRPGLALRIVLGVLPLIWIYKNISLREAVQSMHHGGPLVVILPIICTALGYLAGAFRWRVLLFAYGGTNVPSALTLMRHNYVSGYFNMLPGGVAGDALRGIRVRACVGDIVTSYTILFVERVLGLVGLLIVASFAAASVTGEHYEVTTNALKIGVVMCLVLSTAALLFPYAARRPRVKRLVDRLPILAKVSAKIPPAQRPGLLVGAIALSVFTQGFGIMAAYSITQSMLPGPQSSAALGVLPMIILVTHVPLVPGGIGQREAAFLYFYGLVGIPATVAVSTSVIALLMVLFVASVGGILYLGERLRGDAAVPGTLTLQPEQGSPLDEPAQIIARQSESHAVESMKDRSTDGRNDIR